MSAPATADAEEVSCPAQLTYTDSHGNAEIIRLMLAGSSANTAAHATTHAAALATTHAAAHAAIHATAAMQHEPSLVVWPLRGTHNTRSTVHTAQTTLAAQQHNSTRTERCADLSSRAHSRLQLAGSSSSTGLH